MKLLTVAALCGALFLLLLCLSDCDGTEIEVVNTLNLNDPNNSKWISVAFFGNVYSFLSQDILWWGNLQDNNIYISGVRVPPQFQPNLAVIIGFGLNPTLGHNIVELYAYSNKTNTLSFVVFDLATQQWNIIRQVGVPSYAFEYLISDNDDISLRKSLFLISLDHVLYIDINSFAVVAELDLRGSFNSLYPVNLVAGVTYYQNNLFIARSASLSGQTLAQIVQVGVQASNFGSFGLYFNHVVYLDSDCDNMFGFGNFLFWPQLRGTNGTLYGWDLVRRNLIFTSVDLGPGALWGKGVAANQATRQAMVVSGSPAGGGYMAWAVQHDDVSVKIVSSRPMQGDKLPSLGIETVESPNCLSVLLAGHNATGFGKITWLRYPAGCH